jgi:hypothetical protein
MIPTSFHHPTTTSSHLLLVSASSFDPVDDLFVHRKLVGGARAVGTETLALFARAMEIGIVSSLTHERVEQSP